MAYWLCITNDENWDAIRKKNIWDVSQRHRNTIAKVKPGDKCLIYVKSTKKDNEILPPRIVAIYEVVSEVFEDRSKIFKSSSGKSEVYPYRIKLKPVKIFEKPVEFKSLILELKFIKNKKRWTGHIQGKAMREIPEEDFRLIVKRAGGV